MALLFHDQWHQKRVRGQRHAQPLFTPGIDPVPIVQEAGWAPGPVWTGVENLAPTGIRSPDRRACSQSLYWLCYPAHKPTYNITYTKLTVTVYLKIKYLCLRACVCVCVGGGRQSCSTYTALFSAASSQNPTGKPTLGNGLLCLIYDLFIHIISTKKHTVSKTVSVPSSSETISSHLQIALTAGPNSVCCDPTLLLDDGNGSSSNNCILLSTQNNKQSTDTKMSHSYILPLGNFGTGTVFQQCDSTFWHRWTTRWMFC